MEYVETEGEKSNQEEEKESSNSNSLYRIDTDSEKPTSSRSQNKKKPSNQQESELITYLTKQYSCTEMFGELILQRYFPGQSILLLWPLWELAMTECPLLIIGDDPTECSHIVLIILSLLAPLRSLADYRPYMTLYEGDVRELAGMGKKGQVGNVVIGVSNPYLKTYIGEMQAVLHFERAHFIEKKYQCPKDLELNAKSIKNFSKIPKEVKHSVVTSSKLYMKPSKIALKHLNLDKSIEESLAINNWILRKHFKEMTETFLSSFNQFLRVNYAVKGTGDPLQMQYNLTKPFKEKEFLDSIHKDNAFCRNYMDGSRDKTIKLYKKFINTTLFRKYMNDRKKEIIQKELASYQQYKH